MGMPTVSYQAYMQGASLPLIPSSKPAGLTMTDAAYTALKTRHGDALATANRQRAAAKGDYIHHTRLRAYCETMGYTYYAQGSVDVLANGLWFEAMVTRSWTDHMSAAFQRTFWRALQY
jgi:hypothetical protein